MIKTILFDLDGVLIDNTMEIRNFWEMISLRFHNIISEEDYHKHVFGCSANQTLKVLFSTLNKSQRDDIIYELNEYEANMSYSLVQGAMQFLVQIKKQDIPLGLVTSSDEIKVNKILNNHKLNNFFKATVTRDVIKHSKPDPECYLKAAQLLSITPAHCLVFEDSISGVQAAVNAGMHCIGVQSQHSLSNKLIQIGAKSVIEDFSEIKLDLNNYKVRLIINQRGSVFYELSK